MAKENKSIEPGLKEEERKKALWIFLGISLIIFGIYLWIGFGLSAIFSSLFQLGAFLMILTIIAITSELAGVSILLLALLNFIMDYLDKKNNRSSFK